MPRGNELVYIEDSQESNCDEFTLSLIGTDYIENFERDKKLIGDMYESLFKYKKTPPLFSEIEGEVINYNFDKCLSKRFEDFESNPRYEAEIGEKYNSEEYGMSYEDFKYECINASATDLFNDISWFFSSSIRDNIHEILISLDSVFIDDYLGVGCERIQYRLLSQVIRSSLKDGIEGNLVANDAQMILFQDMYCEEYEISEDDFLDLQQTLYTEYVTDPKTHKKMLISEQLSEPTNHGGEDNAFIKYISQ